MNKALLAQLGLAKEAGTKAMAKDFFANPPSPGTDPEAAAGEAVQTSAPEGMEGAEGAEAPPELDGMTPEQLEELLAMLEAQGPG